MNNRDGFKVNENIPNVKITKNRKIILLMRISAIIVLIFTIVLIQRNLAPKAAENAVAVYLSKNWDNNSYSFLSFEKVYSNVELKGFKYCIEISGTANVSLGSKSKDEKPFSAKVYLYALSWDNIIEEIIVDNHTIFPK